MINFDNLQFSIVLPQENIPNEGKGGGGGENKEKNAKVKMERGEAERRRATGSSTMNNSLNSRCKRAKLGRRPYKGNVRTNASSFEDPSFALAITRRAFAMWRGANSAKRTSPEAKSLRIRRTNICSS